MRDFPFDPATCAAYETPFRADKTGVAQLAQVLLLREVSLLMMLAFYGDGSGEHGKGTFVVAGYIADTRDWFELERLWCNELNRAPSIPYFKASHCIRRSYRNNDFGGPFKGWTDDAVNTKRLRLAEIVKSQNHRLAEVSSSVHWDDYRHAIGNGPTSKVLYNPYFFCFNGAAKLAIETADELFPDHPGRIAFVLDTESEPLDRDVKIQFDLAKSSLPAQSTARMGSTTWDTDIKFPMLQVADLLAWSIRADDESLPSPVLSVLRDRPIGSPGGGYRRQWRRDRMVSLVGELDGLARRYNEQQGK